MNNTNPYSGRIDPSNGTWKDSPWTTLLKERYYLASLFCKDKLVLDTCCGTGWGTLNYISPLARFTTGFDLSINKMPHSKKVCFLAMDARNISFEEDSFDVVLAMDSLEHFSIEDGKRYLSEMKKVCKEHGFIFGTTPLIPDNSLIPVYLEWNKYHIRVYTQELLTEILQNIFPYIKIYKIHNRICPYYIFVCGKNIFPIEIDKKITEFISSHKKELLNGKLRAYLRWIKWLLIKKTFRGAGRLFLLLLFRDLKESF